MFGFLFGTACMLGLVKMARHARHERHGGCHGGRHGFRGRHGGHGHRGGWGGPRMSVEGGIKHVLIRKLGLREEQEVTLDAALQDARKAVERWSEDMKESRGGLASAVRGDRVDHVRLGVLFEGHDESTRELRQDLVRALERLHAALDPEQRIRLSDLLSTDGFGWFAGGES